MNKFTTVLSLSFVAFLFTGAFSHAANKTTEVAQDEFKLIKVAELEQWMTSNKDNTFVFDANNSKTREKSGVIPGAKLLKNSSKYDLAILPTDKNANLVFYCANEMCMASHDAAKVAVKAGYKNVNVLSPGIEGWVKAGKQTEKFTKSPQI